MMYVLVTIIDFGKSLIDLIVIPLHKEVPYINEPSSW